MKCDFLASLVSFLQEMALCDYDSNILPLGYIHLIEKEHILFSSIPNEIIHVIILFLYFGASDLSMIVGDIDIKTISDSIHYRYFQNKRTRSNYTWISNQILISINPYQSQSPINNNQTLNEFLEYQKKGQISLNKPHPFAIAAIAFNKLQKHSNQSIIITGESGSGKV